MSEKKPYLIINEDQDEIKINFKFTRPYMELQSVINELKDLCEEFNLGKYDYSIPVFRVEEILEKVGGSNEDN